MITQPEFVAGSKNIDAIALKYELEVARAILDAPLPTAIKQTYQVANQYHLEIEQNTFDTLVNTGNTAIDHYTKVLELNLTNSEKNVLVSTAIRNQYEIPYYGATLEQRQRAARIDNASRIKRSAFVGKKEETRRANLTRVFRNPYPFGAAMHTDKRILLGQVVKLEHDIAMAAAQRAEVDLVKWTLSHQHSEHDICDALAAYYDPDVAKYITTHKIDVGVDGVYFLKDVPKPPHPNCRCTLVFIHKGRLTSSLVDRAIERLRQLLGSLRRKR